MSIKMNNEYVTNDGSSSKEKLKLPAARPVDELRSSRCRESSKCKEVIPFYCSSLANPVRLRRTTGNALAVAFSTIEVVMEDLNQMICQKHTIKEFCLQIIWPLTP